MVLAVPARDTIESLVREVPVREAGGGRERPARPLGLVPPAAPGLELAASVIDAWANVPPQLRAYVEALLGRPRAPTSLTFEVAGQLPESFARDLTAGGAVFRAAFPTLTRRVASVTSRPSHTFVQVVCQGRHEGPFYDVFAPTNRLVEFDVIHRLAADPDDRLVDRIILDLRAIVLQLVRPCAPTLDSLRPE